MLVYDLCVRVERVRIKASETAAIPEAGDPRGRLP